MGTESDYRKWFSEAKVELEGFEDVSARVRKTWRICLVRLCELFRRPNICVFSSAPARATVFFAVTIVRIWLAYALGAMRYGIFTARKPRKLDRAKRLGRYESR